MESDKISEEMAKDTGENKIVEEYPKIIKDLVVGFLIVKAKIKDGTSCVNMIPLDSGWDGFNGDHNLDIKEEIIGVVPSPIGSYKVLGLFPCENGAEEYPKNGAYGTLGYEYQGSYHPDWNKLLEEKIEDKEYKKRRKYGVNKK